MLDESWMHLNMKRWTHFSVKNKLKSLKSWLKRDLSVTHIFIFFLFFTSKSDTNVPQYTVGAGHSYLCNRDNFNDWSLQMALQKVQYDKPPRTLPAILLIISTFTLIIMWFPPSSYSVIILWLLIQSYIIDHSILTGVKVHSCCLIHHNSWCNHQSVGHLHLQLEYTSLHRYALHLYTMYKINSESWLEYNWKVLTGKSM